ncbi:MAG TPA: cytochrome c-type biogenesis protein [Gemmatimonadaceae bacterium]|nr:cytochrome c-type biogenesis protein [Gemmatimonadaceae bacterium]
MIAALKGLAFAALLLTQQPMSAADSAELDRKTREVATELRCPVCQGESIQESPAELSQEMKAIVREQLAAGKTPDEVKAYFVGRYGEWILLRPTTSGVNALLYWLPPVLLIAGAVLVIVIARRWTKAGADATTPPVTPDNVS